MNHAWELFKDNTSNSRTDARQLLDEFCPGMQMESDDEVIDVGCGPGDVTSDILLPKLHPAARVIGVDLDSYSIEHAVKHYSSSRLNFKIVDFGSKDITNSLPKEHFSFLFSIYCFHWIKDQRQVIKNISAVLRPGGVALFTSICWTSLLSSWKLLSEMDRWKPFMEDVDKILDLFSPDKSSKTFKLLQEVGMVVEVCDTRDLSSTYPNIDKLSSFLMSVAPFVGRIPESMRECYKADMERILRDYSLCEVLNDFSVSFKYSALVVFCRKPYLDQIKEDKC